MDISQHDMDELKMAAEKSLATGSVHSRKLVAIDADKLLWLLERVREDAEMRKEMDKIHEDAKECTCVRTPPYDGCDVHS